MKVHAVIDDKTCPACRDADGSLVAGVRGFAPNRDCESEGGCRCLCSHEEPMTDNRESIRAELNAALSALATAEHALDMAAVLAKQGGDPVACYRYRVIAHDASCTEDCVIAALGENELS